MQGGLFFARHEAAHLAGGIETHLAGAAEMLPQPFARPLYA